MSEQDAYNGPEAPNTFFAATTSDPSPQNKKIIPKKLKNIREKMQPLTKSAMGTIRKTGPSLGSKVDPIKIERIYETTEDDDDQSYEPMLSPTYSEGEDYFFVDSKSPPSELNTEDTYYMINDDSESSTILSSDDGMQHGQTKVFSKISAIRKGAGKYLSQVPKGVATTGARIPVKVKGALTNSSNDIVITRDYAAEHDSNKSPGHPTSPLKQMAAAEDLLSQQVSLSTPGSSRKRKRRSEHLQSTSIVDILINVQENVRTCAEQNESFANELTLLRQENESLKEKLNVITRQLGETTEKLNETTTMVLKINSSTNNNNNSNTNNNTNNNDLIHEDAFQQAAVHFVKMIQAIGVARVAVYVAAIGFLLFWTVKIIRYFS